MNPKLITTLDIVPIISLVDCRLHLRIDTVDDSPDTHPDDELVLALLAAAREWVEGYTGLALTPRTLELGLDRFPANEILLPTPPTISVESVKYFDTAGDEQTITSTDYVLDDYQRPGWILPAEGYVWPTTKEVVNAVTIRYEVGYASRLDSPQVLPLPASLRAAVLLILGSLYENRENTAPITITDVPLGAKSLCDWLKVRTGMA